MDNSQWCILRTGAARTLPLAASLAAAGLTVWTPTQMVRRAGRGRQRRDVEERAAPITPTFVFASAGDLYDLIRIASDPVSRHPPFSIFRHRDRYPLIFDRSLAPLREEENRHRLRQLKKTRRVLELGSSIRLAEGPFAGMTGIVEGGNGKQAVVNFGSGFLVSIATYLLETDVVQDGNKPTLGVAA
jgi:hypothetical protein